MRKFLAGIKMSRVVFLALSFAPAIAWSADDVVAILSSGLPAYKEAFQAFQSKLGRPVVSYQLDKESVRIAPDKKLVIAFGSKAIQEKISGEIPIIYALSPNVSLDSRQRKASTVRIEILPSPADVIPRQKTLQPSLKTLAVFWVSDTFKDYVSELANEAAPHGVRVVSVQINEETPLPDAVRAIHRKADAIWMLPDSVLVTPENFAVMKDFAVANKVVFYAPSLGLAKKGATAAILPGYADIGAVSAEVANKILSGSSASPVVYPSTIQVLINKPVAVSVGLRFSGELMFPIELVE